MELIIKHYSALSADEVYDILQARAQVFVLEQVCPYLDPDGTDRDATHVMLRDDNGLAAYLRVTRLDDSTAKIGRVLTIRRGQGLGLPLLEAGIREARKLPGVTSVYIEAQSYAVGFYDKAGFRVEGDEFLEDCIPHKGMRLML